MSAPQPAKGVPERIVHQGRYVRLEPLAIEHAADLYAASIGPGVPERYRWLFNEPPASLAEMEGWVTEAAVDTAHLYFSVIDLATGRCEGRQSFMRIAPADGSVEIGGVYWGPRMARTRMATEALYLFARHAFDDLGYRRFEWKWNDRNAPSKAAALRFGFTFEGLFRQAMIVKGENRDTAWFSIIDKEWPERRAEFERWLAPDNFEPDGTQLTPLAMPRA
jgi:RimJ/RimL family protein N-acetyltransferase